MTSWLEEWLEDSDFEEGDEPLGDPWGGLRVEESALTPAQIEYLDAIPGVTGFMLTADD